MKATEPSVAGVSGDGDCVVPSSMARALLAGMATVAAAAAAPPRSVSLLPIFAAAGAAASSRSEESLQIAVERVRRPVREEEAGAEAGRGGGVDRSVIDLIVSSLNRKKVESLFRVFSLSL